ncbi:hypothetical protein IWW40_000067 [Coemansia sp. RSA 1250]|nr:hypothetical protein IWW40_000067 [Coemansia sp. RSA 1250]
MGRLSLAIGRQKEAGEVRSKPRHLRSSIKGFLGIPGAERASVDLGDIDHSSLDDNASQSSVRNSINQLHRLHEQQSQAAPFESSNLAKRSESGFADSQPTHPIIREHRTLKASHNSLRTTASSVPLHAYAEDAAPRIERNSVGADRDMNSDSDKSSWRRRGSLISSRLTVPLRKDTASNNGASGSRVLVRKESTPQLDAPSRTSGQLPPHPELPDQAKSPFWRGSSTLRVAGPMAPADTAEAGATQQERTHRSSSVPFLTPIPPNATTQTQISSTVGGRSVASPYLRAVSSGLSTQSMRRSARGYSSTHQDRFPKLVLNEENGSPSGSPIAAMSPSEADPTPMTFLVSPRARASSSIKHNPLSNTPSRELNLSKRTLSSSTIPSLELNAPASPRALTGGVDMSEFGVVAPSSVGPSSLSESTPISTTFEPLHESAEDTELCSGAGKPADAVHETHHMEVQHDPRTGRKMINQYMIIRELGRGTHGKVKLAFDTVAGEYYAIKVIDKESRGRGRRMRQSSAAYRSHRRSHGYLRIDLDKMEKVKREIAILKKCRHPNVVRLREVIDDAHARRIYLVIEFMDGGEIAWRDSNNLPAMAADKARSVFRDLVVGVEYLHYVGILHRDLKPQNLLCNRAGTVKISDFGVSFLSRQTRKPPSQRAMQPLTTPPAASPQPPDRPAPAGAQLHHFASQPLMSGMASPNRPADGVALHRKASALSRGSGVPGSPSGSESSSLRIRAPPIRHPHYAPPASQLQRHISQSVRRQATLGMTDEFGNCQSEPLELPADGMAASPGHKLPPECMSADASVYDPFDSSESAEFFSSSDDEGSEYGSQLPPSSLGMSGAVGGMEKLALDGASEDGGSDNGIVFGVLPSPSKTTEMQPSSSQGHSGHQRKGTLGEITFDYDEKDEERELAKTAGTPAFFAPELCCTAEELAKVLKEERLRRQARPSLEPPHSAVQLPLADGESEAGSSARPASLFIESPALGEGLRGPSKITKRHSALTSLLSRPFSSKGRPSTGNSSQSSIRAPSARQDDADAHSDDELAEQPLPANVITPAIDIWAMGVTLYCLIYGRVPFQATTEFELFNIIPRKPLEFPEYLEVAEGDGDEMLFGIAGPASAAGSTNGRAEHKPARRVSLPPLDPDLRDLLTRLLDKDFRTRITIDEIKRHPWVLKDLDRPSTWATETDPKSQPSVTITTREVEQAMVPKVRQRRGFRASVKHRISMLSPRTSKHQRPESRHPVHMGGAKAKSSLDWLKIW